MKTIFIAVGLILTLASCSPNPAQTFSNAAVVSARKEASDIGISILKQGGNAFDAMIATELALAVSYPFAGNISGGGFMVYLMEDGTVGSLDYREKAPLAADENYYLNENGEVLAGKSTLGATAVGIPGTIAGLFEVHRKFGSLPIETLFKPAIELAQKGFIITERQQQSFNYYDSLFTAVNGRTLKLFHNRKVGDTLVNTALANTLEIISKKGEDAFYKGEITEKMINFLRSNGGDHSVTDFSNYQAVWRNPVDFDFEGFRIISMGPPSSGGITLQQIFGMLESFKLKEQVPNSASYIHKLSEVFRRAYADRNYYLGDPDFIDIPVTNLTDKDYLAERISNFMKDTVTPSEVIKPGIWLESDETTHYSIVDQDGNAVSVTTTLNGGYGSKLFHEELGFFYNNEMDDFSSKPGVPNMFGLIGSEANAIAPGKRMLSSMTPTIVEKDGMLFLVVGTPGGSTIITAVAQVILRTAIYNEKMQEAVDAPRFHHQGLPNVLVLEPSVFERSVVDSLRSIGYTISEKTNRIIGKVNAIKIDRNGKLETGADSRGDDAASGF